MSSRSNSSSVMQLLRSFIANRYLSTATLGLAGTGLYVTAQDKKRIPRMTRVFSTGRILPPFSKSTGHKEVSYCHRPKVENKLHDILSSSFSNEYYVIVGQVGSGKSRMIREIIEEKMATAGKKKEGAPIYICANQGLSLSDTLGKSVDFYYDEHISIKYFVDFAMGIQKFPEKADHKRLARGLAMIEQAAYRYVQEHHKPVVLVVDGVDYLSRYYPEALTMMQEKAKLWADTNIVKTVFVCTDERTEELLQKDNNLWTRAAKPLYIGDMEYEEAKWFLKEGSKCASILARVSDHRAHSITTDDHEMALVSSEVAGMHNEYIERVIQAVGGRPCRLISFIYDWVKGVPFEDTLEDLVQKESEKLKALTKNPEVSHVISVLKQEQNPKLEKIRKKVSIDTIKLLQKTSIIRCKDTAEGTAVLFDSGLVKAIAEDLK